MKVAIVTPYFNEPLSQLEQCVESVYQQTFVQGPIRKVDDQLVHFMVSDGGDPNNVRVLMRGDSVLRLVELGTAHLDFGNTARAVGALCAINEGCDAIGFLDADNWLEPRHVELMLDLGKYSGAPVVAATRSMHRVDGSLMWPVDTESDGEEHCDTSCVFLLREALWLAPLWGSIPKELSAIGDRLFWNAVKRTKLGRIRCPKPTVCYRTRYAVHYRALGEPPPLEAKENVKLEPGYFDLQHVAMRTVIK